MHAISMPAAPLQSSLIRALLDRDAYPHPVDDITMLETHISWVLLAGEFAYKIKKPISLGFLDFTGLEDRHYFCEEEIRLNRKWAPETYLGVVGITNDNGILKVQGQGPVVEYAVQMKRFPQASRLDRQLLAGQLTAGDMIELAEKVAKVHRSARQMTGQSLRRYLDFTRDAMLENFDFVVGKFDAAAVSRLLAWTQAELQRLEPLLVSRHADGFVRECHGDLHLANLVRLPSGIVAFDCLEFNEDLRNSDVCCDTSFLVMDLISQDRRDLAFAFLNRYLEVTGDYASLGLFNLFFVYRCLVRAKVAAIRAQEREASDPAWAEDMATVRMYCELAQTQTGEREPMLVLMHGLSASGKTWASGQLMTALPAIRLRSDIERKRLHGLDEQAASGSPVAGGIYSAEASEALYGHLLRQAWGILRTGHDVIIDATFAKHCWRRNAASLANEAHAEFAIVETVAPLEALRCRLLRRASGTADVSEATRAVLDYQLEHIEPLTPWEQGLSLTWRTDDGADADSIVGLLRRLKVQELAATELQDSHPH
jgi:aminoglycoside phosphotransferase family enzyme